MPTLPTKPSISELTQPDSATPTRQSFLDIQDETMTVSTASTTPEPILTTKIFKASEPVGPVILPKQVQSTDESDTDFQSAYSASPRDSLVDPSSNPEDGGALSDTQPPTVNIEDRLSVMPKTRRERVSSTSTATGREEPTTLPTRNRPTIKA